MRSLKRSVLKEIREIVDEDHLMPPPELGEPHYLKVDDEEDDCDGKW